MVRLIALAVLGYLLYRWLKPRRKQDRPDRAQPGPAGVLVDDEMVQDPHCGAWFPRSSGVEARVGGKKLLFCSEKCRNAYKQASRNNKNND